MQYNPHVYFSIDLPTILSGNRLAYLEPHEEIWPRKSGRWYEIDKKVHCSDTFSPFEGLCGFSVQNGEYNHTLFRFPLRDKTQEERVSPHTYDIDKLRNLLVALQKEAKCILLFLRSVRSVEVFEIGKNGLHSNILKISICEISDDNLSEKRANFKADLQSRFDSQSFGVRNILTQVVHVEVKVEDSHGSMSSSKWLVANQVGSESDNVREHAKELKVFPWVGVALETSAIGIEATGGRVFCVLPMPLEVTCNLPVHVNGTFSLNDERRELKWQGIERQNDPSAQWNHLLVKELLPPCYAMLLLDHAKLLLEQDKFCQAWPNTDIVRETHWADMLSPLLNTLFSKDVIPFSKPGRSTTCQWINVSSAIFVPREQPLPVPAAVRTALLECGIKLVTVLDTTWNALIFCEISCTTISPSIARNELREKPESYEGLTSDEKLDLLQYCLSDDAYDQLYDLALLPLVSERFAKFDAFSSSPIYLCSKNCPHHLLPSLDSELVNENVQEMLHTKLSTLANKRCSNLQALTCNSVAKLLQKILPEKNKITLPYLNIITMQWLETFWQWVGRKNLGLFENLPLVPVGDDAIVPLSKASSALFIPSTQSYDQILISGLEKLGVQCCQQKEHLFVDDPGSLMNVFSAEGILNAIYYVSMSYEGIMLTKEEAMQLITRVCSAQVDPKWHAKLRELPIFLTKIPEEKLYSVAQVEALTKRKAEMEPPDFPLNPNNLPKGIILFSESDPYQKIMLKNISVHCPSTVDILLRLVFPEIKQGGLGRTAAKEIMKEVLEKYSVITSSIANVEAFQQAIATLPFVPVSKGKPKAPNTLYSPFESQLKDLFFKEPVFPVDPFCTKEHIEVLQSCGLKTSVLPQEVVEIICSICSPANDTPVEVDKVNHTRARAVLTYIEKWDKELSEKVCIVGQHKQGGLIFSEALKELALAKSWLPIQSSPPQNYPQWLSWKGKRYSSHLVSFASSVLLHEEQLSLALACGSQMYFVDHSLPNAICTAFEPSAEVMIRHIMANLKEVILSGKRNEDVRKVTHTIYGLLNKYCSDAEGCTVDVAQLEETQNCVWLTRQKKFVHPQHIALQQNEKFPHNLEPFVYILPDDLAQYECLFKDLGVQEMVSREQILGILPTIKDGDSQSLDISSEKAWQLVMTILRWLTDSVEGKIDEVKILVPVRSDEPWPQLTAAKEVVYTDNDFLRKYLESSEGDKSQYVFIHYLVTPMAHKLNVTPLSQHLDISEDAFEDVGQSEPLTVRLKNILKDYKDGLTIIKELLQNADDALATEMNICHDKRYHTDKRGGLFFPGMADCHGPALVVNNNAMFTEEDFVNITKLAGATKERKHLKIGKFGIGFCSVYHITDVPSFVSSELLYIFDPTLKYLKDEIKNLAAPGKRVRFTSRFFSQSKQLEPYVGLYGFNPEVQYKGTTFRFPFRTGESELSEKMYRDEDVKQLLKEMQNSSSKLVLFLQNIKTITLSAIERAENQPRELMRITKDTENLAEGRCIHTITCSVSGSTDVTEYWLVETSSQTVLQKYSTASVACSLSPLRDEGCYRAETLEGEIFCFLPLSIKTGLPVHVSSNFAVINNRRGIWTSDESDSTRSEEVEWNISLMEGVICRAYCGLLKELSCNSKLEEYEYFLMWPVEKELRVLNPWHHCVKAIYIIIEKSELFFSDSTDKWLTLKDSKFLDPNILRVSYDTPFPSAVLEIVKHKQLPVVHLPEKYHEYLDLTESIETEKIFLEYFFDIIEQLKGEDVVVSRNNVLYLALKCYASKLGQAQEERFLYLHMFLKDNACVPCSPDGKELKKAKELIHPDAIFAKLFDKDEKMFPLNRFSNDTVFVDKAMKELGMLHESIPLCYLEERATGIADLYRVDVTKALERVQIIIKCLVKEDEKVTLSSEKCSNLSHIPFLPVMEKPESYMLEWKGNSATLYRGCDIFISGHFKDETMNIFLAGSQLVFLNQKPPSNGGCGSVHERVQTLLQIRSCPSYTDVIVHFHHLIVKFQQSEETPQELIELANCTSKKVYEFLDKHLASTTPEECKRIGTLLAEKPCIWTGEGFVECKVVAISWKHNGPYLFKVPAHLENCKGLINTLEIREAFGLEDLVVALKRLKKYYGKSKLPLNCQELVKSIVFEIPAQRPEDNIGPIMLPDNHFVMHEAKELYHNDMPWTEHDEHFNYVHEKVPLKTALALGVKRCRSAVLGEYSRSGIGLGFVRFGQHEELTRRIQNIIRDYPFDMTILKELLQNADDAKATKMHVILDMREHSKEHLLSENWGELQGPALLVWNDSVFTDDDLIGLQRLGLGSKRSDSETIGQYGIGFNAVYHLTDCPSFLTGGDKLCILDPHMKYFEGATERHPGAMFTGLDKKFWQKFDGMKSTYLQDGLKNRPDELLKGTLFRFPLRHSFKHVQSSDIVRDLGDSVVLSAQRMYDLLKEWAPNMKQSLLFLNYVVELKFFVIDSDETLKLQNGYRTELDESARKERSELTQKMKSFANATTSEPFIATYPLTIAESDKDVKEEWLIQQGIGDMEKSVKTWSYIEQVKPRHGIAAPLKHKGDTKFSGQVFCFLPLPLYSGLPVHINGHFILNSTRRNLWVATDPRREDSKSQWNKNIQQAIAASYAQFLERIPEYFPQLKGLSSREAFEEGVKEYDACFPRTDLDKISLSEPWLALANQVFQILSNRNSPVLAVPTRASKDMYVLHWHSPKNVKMPTSQVYFPMSQEKNLILIFERIGMKITCAPKWIRDHFIQVNCQIPAISQSSVYEFYTRFHTRFFSARFPQPIQDTPFQGVEDFKAFTNFLLQRSSFPGEPFGYPLLLNNAEQLCCFDRANKVLCSNHFHMFPNSPSKFLHRELIECSHSSLYFISENDEKVVRMQIVKELLETILPPELKRMCVSTESDALTKFDIKGLWKCFSNDKVFLSVLDEVLKVWALLPTEDKRLFQCHSPQQLLPIVVDALHYKVVSVMKQIQAPILDLAIVPVNAAPALCPKLSDHKAVLKNLVHLYNGSPFLEMMTKHIAGILVEYFSCINLRKDNQCCQQLKCLPLFEKMDGNLTILQGKEVYIWPTNICQEGNEQWLTVIEGNFVFLNPNGKWTRLGVQSELQILRITAEDAYLKFIFPSFSKMCKNNRYHHLKYIRDTLFSKNYSYYISGQNVGRNYWALQNDYYSACRFIEGLKSLSCIGEDGENLKPVSHFYTHEKQIFQTFPEHFQTLPKDLLQGDIPRWMDFFKKIGLKVSVDANTFTALCKYVADGKLKEETETGSKVLLHYLFLPHEAQQRRLHQNVHLLRTISQIPFVCPVPVPELEWIHKVPQAPNRVIFSNGVELPLCKLLGSCLSQHKQLIWATKSVIAVPHSQNEVVQYLGICLQPTAKDLIENVSRIAKTCFSDQNLFIKYTAPQCKPNQEKLMDVMVKIFVELQNFKVDVTGLRSLIVRALINVHNFGNKLHGQKNIYELAFSTVCYTSSKDSHIQILLYFNVKYVS